MESVNFLRTCAVHSSKLLRKNVLNCWGSNQKVRNSSSKLFGFSASVTLFGFGIQAFRKNSADALKDSSWDFVPGNLLTTGRKFPAPNGNNGFNVFNAIKSFSFLTPVFCLGEDTICSCCSKRESMSTNVSGNRVEVFNCDCCSKECYPKGGSKEDGNWQLGQSSEQTSSSSNFNSNNGNNNADTEKGQPSSSGGTNSFVSNKPCRSSAACSQVTDIDIDALAKELGGLSQINFDVDSDLSHCFLIKQASQITVDSVTRILTETAAAYEDYHAEYRRVLDMMIDNLEESRSACGAELEVLECKIILIRAKVDEMKRKISELDMFLGSLEKLGAASAETAFMASAEYASVAIMERLYSMNIEVKRLRDQSKERERDMIELQSLIIVESGKGLK